ncbi:MAG: hypothetical protein HY720_24490 [Planctomycetes bacterium]|nr:hypothetical protein [Planctomycetota bacterium]
MTEPGPAPTMERVRSRREMPAGSLSPSRAKWIDAVLAGLVLFDASLAAWAFFLPDFWFRAFHGTAYDDPQGFLRRCAANWAAFALIQLAALLLWRKNPHGLAVAAGARLSDVFTDWTYLAFAQDITWFGRASLACASPANALLGWWLLRAWRQAGGRESGPADK